MCETIRRAARCNWNDADDEMVEEQPATEREYSVNMWNGRGSRTLHIHKATNVTHTTADGAATTLSTLVSVCQQTEPNYGVVVLRSSFIQCQIWIAEYTYILYITLCAQRHGSATAAVILSNPIRYIQSFHIHLYRYEYGKMPLRSSCSARKNGWLCKIVSHCSTLYASVCSWCDHNTLFGI